MSGAALHSCPGTRAACRTLHSCTLLPFLYQTRTIRLSPRLSRGKEADDDIPFENSDSSPPRTRSPLRRLEEAVPFVPDQRAANALDPRSFIAGERELPQSSTITSTERAAFNELFSMAADTKTGRGKRASEAALEFRKQDFMESFPSSLRSMAETAGQIILEQHRHKVGKSGPKKFRTNKGQEPPIVDQSSLPKLRENKARRIESLLAAAETDAELWEVLDQEVFAVIRKLDLDQALKKGHDTYLRTLHKAKARKDDMKHISTTDLSIIGPNYPVCLLLAMRRLRTQFPGSPLRLHILPTVVGLGRGSFALGANTPLYNEHLRALWETHQDGAMIVGTLVEMDEAGIDFDEATLDIIFDVQVKLMRNKSGQRGPVVQVISGLGRQPKIRVQLGEWREKIRQRLENDALRKAMEAQEEQEVREEQESPEDAVMEASREDEEAETAEVRHA